MPWSLALILGRFCPENGGFRVNCPIYAILERSYLGLKTLYKTMAFGFFRCFYGYWHLALVLQTGSSRFDPWTCLNKAYVTDRTLGYERS